MINFVLIIQQQNKLTNLVRHKWPKSTEEVGNLNNTLLRKINL